MDFYMQSNANFCYVEYKTPFISRYKEFKIILADILSKNLKCLIYGDYDPDGMMSVMSWKNFFMRLKFDNYDIVKYTVRTHTIDPLAIKEAVEGGYDYLIINDAGSMSMEDLKYLDSQGVRVILIDHHETKYYYDDYPSGVFVINSTIENKMKEDTGDRFFGMFPIGDEPLKVSAGALVFILLDAYLADLGIPSGYMCSYALLSLYADCIDMDNNTNKGIYYRAYDLDENLPPEIKIFLEPYLRFCRRFVEYYVAPKLNAAFRSENFECLNRGFLCKRTAAPSVLMEMKAKVIDLHSHSKEIVEMASDTIVHEVWNNFVVAKLNTVDDFVSVNDNKLYNYTGLIANKLAERYNKSAVVYCVYNGAIKGSFRDLQQRNYLSIFQKFCDANGHQSAFGFKLGFYEVSDFLACLRIVDADFEQKSSLNSPIIVDDLLQPDYNLLDDMAIYNEFAGVGIPLALVKLTRRVDMTESRNKYDKYIYKWGIYAITSVRRIPVGEPILIRPTVGKGLKLYAI